MQARAQDGMPGGFKCFEFGFDLGVLAALRVNVNEDAVVAIGAGRSQGFAGNWNNAFALFASALGNQLLGP